MGEPEWVGTSSGVRLAHEQIREAAPTELPLLISGEPGTGRYLAARTLHALSGRRERPLVRVHCGALHPAQAARVLFGDPRASDRPARVHAREAAHLPRPTPAARLRVPYLLGGDAAASAPRVGGALRDARGGTLFLDEVGQLPLVVQQELLNHLPRPSAVEAAAAPVRLVASTTSSLQRAAREGLVCPELYYRLAIVPVHLEPLRERLEDLPLLAAHFARQFGMGSGDEPVDREALRELAAYAWPGNVWELKSLFRRAAVLGGAAALTAPRVRTLLAEAPWMRGTQGPASGKWGLSWSSLPGRN